MIKKADGKFRVIVTGGGTGGHVYPALAVVEELKKRYGSNVDYLYAGTPKGMEARLAVQSGVKFAPVNAAGLMGKPGIKAFRAAITNLKGISEAKKLIRSFRPDVVLGTGGFVCAPMCFAAALCKVPYVIHEQNSYPGSANRLLARKAATVAISIAGTEKLFADPKKCVYTGNPVRSEIIATDRATARQRLGIAFNDKVVLVVGGSLGARALNNAMLEALPLIGKLDKLQIIMITGKNEFEKVAERLSELKPDGHAQVSLLAYADNMHDYLAAADVAVSRAGATTIAELAGSATPAIFVPYPHATADHQKKNAMVMCETGAAVMIEEKDLTAQGIAEKLKSMLDDPDILNRMSKAAGDGFMADAAKEIVDLLEAAAAYTYKGSV